MCKIIYGLSDCTEDNPGALAGALYPVYTHIPYNDFLIAPAYIYTFFIVKYLL